MKGLWTHTQSRRDLLLSVSAEETKVSGRFFPVAWTITPRVQAGLGLSGSVLRSVQSPNQGPRQPGLDASAAQMPGPALPGLSSSPDSVSPPGREIPSLREEAASLFLTPLIAVLKVCWFSLSPMRIVLFWFVLKLLFISAAPYLGLNVCVGTCLHHDAPAQ